MKHTTCSLLMLVVGFQQHSAIASVQSSVLRKRGLQAGGGPPPDGGGGGGGGGGTATCSASQASFGTVSAGECIDFVVGESYQYPQDFPILNEVSIYVCPVSDKRIIVSNGIPDHDLTQNNPNTPCVHNWMLTMPLNPTLTDTMVEPSALGIIAMSLNGVPVFGPQEGGGLNAAETTVSTFDGVPFYGHAARSGDWHYHSGEFGVVEDMSLISSDTLLGYAADGFPIYGPVDDPDTLLDACNGLGSATTDAEFRYHVRTLEQVDEFGTYCDGTSPAITWKYVLGCYRGDLSNSRVDDSSTTALPADCVLEGDNTGTVVVSAPTMAPVSPVTSEPISSGVVTTAPVMDPSPPLLSNPNSAGNDNTDNNLLESNGSGATPVLAGSSMLFALITGVGFASTL